MCAARTGMSAAHKNRWSAASARNGFAAASARLDTLTNAGPAAHRQESVIAHTFWHPIKALVEEPGGWRLESHTGSTLGVIVPTADRFGVWLRSGDSGRRVASCHDLPTAARRLWNAAHPYAQV